MATWNDEQLLGEASREIPNADNVQVYTRALAYLETWFHFEKLLYKMSAELNLGFRAL